MKDKKTVLRSVGIARPSRRCQEKRQKGDGKSLKGGKLVRMVHLKSFRENFSKEWFNAILDPRRQEQEGVY